MQTNNITPSDSIEYSQIHGIDHFKGGSRDIIQ